MDNKDNNTNLEKLTANVDWNDLKIKKTSWSKLRGLNNELHKSKKTEP